MAGPRRNQRAKKTAIAQIQAVSASQATTQSQNTTQPQNTRQSQITTQSQNTTPGNRKRKSPDPLQELTPTPTARTQTYPATIPKPIGHVTQRRNDTMDPISAAVVDDNSQTVRTLRVMLRAEADYSM